VCFSSSSSSFLYSVLNRQQPALRTKLISAKAPEDRWEKERSSWGCLGMPVVRENLQIQFQSRKIQALVGGNKSSKQV